MNLRSPGVLPYTSAANSICRFIEVSYPALLTRIQPALSMSNATAGLLSSVYSLGFGTGSMASGILCDRIGARYVVILAFGGAAVVAVLTALSGGPWQLGLALAFLGLFPGLYLPAGFTLISRGAKDRGIALGLHGVAGALGRAVAPMLLVAVALAGSWRTSYLAVSAIAGSFALFALFSTTPVRPERTVEEEAAATTTDVAEAAAAIGRTSWMPLLFVYTAFLLAGISFRSMVTFLPKHFEAHADNGLSSVFFATTLLAGAGGQMFGGYISKRATLERLALAVTLLCVPEFLLTAVLTGVPLVISAGALFFTLSSFAPIIAGLIADNAPVGGLGKSFGYGTFITTSLGAVGPAATGLIVDADGTAAAFALLALPMGLAAAATLPIPRKRTLPEAQAEW